MFKHYAYIFFIFLAATAVAAETQNTPIPTVDERTELLGIVFRLAGANEYQCIHFKKYDDLINEHFKKFRNHAAVKTAKMLRRRGIGYDAVVAFAIHLDIENGHAFLPGEHSDKTLDILTKRWSAPLQRMFIKPLDDFYVESRFHEFFESNREMYEKSEQNIRAISDKIDYPWFGKFYGNDNLENFRLVLCLTSETNGYGPTCRYKDGREEFYAILGDSGPDVKNNVEAFIPFLVHEFNHSYCNPLIDKHIDELKPAADRLFQLVEKKMTEQAYSLSTIMLYEYLVRACEIQYLQQHDKQAEAKQRIELYKNLGFVWLEELVDAINRYEKERETYPTLESFMPQIVKLQNEITDEHIAKLKKIEENRPKIVSTIPATGQKNVDPSTTEISVTFDRKMRTGMAWCSPDGNATFPKPTDETSAKWSEDGKTCTLHHIRLEPGKTYNICLNLAEHDNFRSEENVPLESYQLTFSTEKSE